MIVVAILADLVLIALPGFLRARDTAQNARFSSDLRTATAGFEMYAAEHTRYPAEAAAGVMPPGMEQYLRGVQWTQRNSLGAVWDWDFEQGYATAVVCTESPIDLKPARMTEIDEKIDNGVLATGAFRERTPNRRWAFIIE